MLPIRPIRAKISIPRKPLDLVARARLVARLNEGLLRPLTLVCAPAGYGKSTLLVEWLQQLQIPAAWLSLEEGDDNLFTFLSYVVAAVQTVYPAFGVEILPLLNAQKLPNLPTLIVALVHDFETLGGEAQDPKADGRGLVLVLDDLYRLTQLPIYDFLEGLIAYLPPWVHLVVGTRTDPLLSLVTLHARGQLSEVRQRELRFTSAETRTFVTQAGTMALDEATAAALEARTDGWAAGLRLFLLSIHDEAGLERLTHGAMLDETDVTSYLIGEVLRKQTPLMQDFLLHLALVERFSLPLSIALFPHTSLPQSTVQQGTVQQVTVQQVTGQPGTVQEVEEMLNQMHRQNLFVTALGDGWYRYHPLLRDLLHNRLLRQLTAEELSELHRRAAAWYESQGMLSEALDYLLRAPDETLAIELFARYRQQALNTERWQQVALALAIFPPQLVEQHPLLAMTQAWLYSSQSQVPRAIALLPRVEAQLAEGNPPLEPAIAQALQGEVYALTSHWFLHYRAQLPEAVASAQRALELLPLEDSLGRSTAYTYLIYGLNHSGDLAGAQAALARGLREAEGRDDTFGTRLMVIKFVMDYFAMNLAGMEEAATQMAVWAQRRHLPESEFNAHYYLGMLAYLRNQLDVANRHFEQVVEKRELMHVGGVASGYVVLVLIHQARGELKEATELLKRADAFVGDSDLPQAMVALEAARAFLALLQGRTGEALAWAEQQDSPPTLVPRVTNMREAAIVLIKCLVSDKSAPNIERAAAMLPGLLNIARVSHAHFLTAELLALQAKLCLNQGDAEAALAHLQEAITLVRPAQPLRLFADLGQENSRALIPLFQELLERGVAPAYLTRLLDVLARRSDPASQPSEPQPQAAASSSQQLVEALTPRERDILALLAQGLSNREIGAQLILSAKTIENYSLMLYAKLFVKSRGQAVAKAREVGLLPR